MSFVSLTRRVCARKEYHCWYCNQPIRVGESHDVRSGEKYGDFWTMRMHPECDAYASEHWNEEDYECHEPGEDFVRPITAFDPII